MADNTNIQEEDTDTTVEQDILDNIPGINDEEDISADTSKVEDKEEDKTLTLNKQEDKDNKVEEPSPKDIITTDDQRIKGGVERRLYEKSQRLQQETTTANARITELEGQLEAVNSAGNIGTQMNLTPDEVVTGAKLISAFKSDPVETVKYLLTQAQAAGHNVDGLGGGSTDVNAIKTMLDTYMKPFVEEREQKQATEQRQQEVTTVYNNFITKYPDATIHESTLAQLLDNDTSLSTEAAYFKLKSFYLERGLDFNKSLDVLEKEAKATGDTQSSLPNGSVSPSGVSGVSDIADVNMSSDDIIRQSMTEAGYKF